MIDKIKNTISIIENEKKCVQTNCDRNCSVCELVKEEYEIVDALDFSLKLLKSYKLIFEDLEKEENFWIRMALKHSNDDFAEGQSLAYHNIKNRMEDLIKQN